MRVLGAASGAAGALAYYYLQHPDPGERYVVLIVGAAIAALAILILNRPPAKRRRCRGSADLGADLNLPNARSHHSGCDIGHDDANSDGDGGHGGDGGDGGGH